MGLHHVHLNTVDPTAAIDFYATKRLYNGVQIAPSAFITADHVSMIIYPARYLRPSQVEPAIPPALVPTRGRVIDHLGFSVDDLSATLERMRKDGVKVTAEPRSVAGGQIKFAFVEGPDQVAIELIEDRTVRPAPVVD